MNRAVDMTKGNPTGLIIRLAIPLIITNLGQQLYGIVDAIIVGRGVGVDAFASLGACDWLVWLVLWAIQGLTQGFGAYISQVFGSKDTKKFKDTFFTCLILCLVLGVVLTLGFVLAAEPLLRLLGTPSNILPGAKTYLTCIYMGTLIVLTYNMSAAILRSVGDGKTPLIAMIMAGLFNIGLDLLFVLVLKMGIMGAALATLLAQAWAGCYCLYVMKKTALFSLTRENVKLHKGICLNLFKMGLPLAFSAVVVDLGGIYAQSVINSYGSIFVAGCTTANKLHGMLDCSAVAIGFAGSTFIGQNYGAGRIDRVRSGIRKAAFISVIIGLAITIFMFIFGKNVVNLFLVSGAEDADGALRIAYEYTMVLSGMLIFAYIMNLYRYACQALGNSRATFISGFYEFGARVLVAMILPRIMGYFGVFFMDGSAWAAAGIYQVICFYKTLGKYPTIDDGVLT